MAANKGTLPGTAPVDELLRIAVAHQRDAVLITEAERVDGRGRRIVFVNEAFTAITGFTAAEAIGQTPGITVGDETDPKALQQIQAAIETKSAVRQELLKYRKDGTTFWAEIDIAPVFAPDGVCIYFVAVLRDASEKKRQSRLLEAQARELQQASALKSQLLANVSHELRTPLNAILGYTSMLLEGVFGDAATGEHKALSRIDANGRHLLSMINELLDITRIEAGRMPVHPSRFGLSELVTEILEELEPTIARSKLLVTSTLASSSYEVESDRQKVKQIVLNLLSNALKFTAEGWVRVGAEASPGWIAIHVEDSGIGIAPEHCERVFEDFWQADGTPSRTAGGTGLGLSISQRFATMLGGDITFESERGKGSRFTLRVPS